MSTYRLIDHGYSFKKIYHGKKWVGRVVKCADGRYYGRINLSTKGHLEAYGDTELAAFRAVASKALGFDNAEQVHEHNRKVLQGNRLRRDFADYAMAEFRKGNTKPFDAMLMTPGTAGHLINAFARDLRKK